jgi:hypothetical protein
VIQDGKLRHRRSAWTLALLLAFAVSFWGIRYKVSLYHPSAAHQGPAAKLLSQKERPVASVQMERSLAPDAGPGKPFASQSHQILAYSLSALRSGSALDTMSRWRALHGLQEDSHRVPFQSIRLSAPRAPPIAA